VAKHSLPEIYLEASAKILTRHLLKTVRGSILQTHPKPYHNKPYGINCWQLIFIADGLNFGRGSIIDKGRGIGSKPISSYYTLGYQEVSFTHLVQISLCLPKEVNPEGGLFWQRLL
jgi:hypothetical protein